MAVSWAQLAETMSVAVTKEFPETVDGIRRALSEHAAEHRYSNVEFVECTSPSYDENQDDYIVAYEAVFRPKDLEHAYLEIWIIDQGRLGIMFEKRARVAKRLGRSVWTGKEACAAGTELASISPNELVAFVRLVAQGKVFLRVRSGILGLGATRAVTSEDSFDTLGATNPREWDWLTVMANQQIASAGSKLIDFEPW